MVHIASIVFAVLLGLLAAFQVALACGAPLGRFAWGGAHTRLPASLRIASVVSILIYGALAAVILQRAGVFIVLPGAARLIGAAAWVVAAYMALGILMNLISRSAPERIVMTPLAAVLCGLAAIVASAPNPT